MSEELRPCPFCGRQPYESGGYVSCHTELCLANADYHEPAIGSITDWNTRPIEDALESRIAELEALVNVSEDLYGRIYEQAARIAELEAERRWIPVSERLPELRVGRVDLVYTVYGEIHSAMYLGNGWTSLYRDFRSNEVTHWMPLPKLPEVQE